MKDYDKMIKDMSKKKEVKTSWIARALGYVFGITWSLIILLGSIALLVLLVKYLMGAI